MFLGVNWCTENYLETATQRARWYCPVPFSILQSVIRVSVDFTLFTLLTPMTWFDILHKTLRNVKSYVNGCLKSVCFMCLMLNIITKRRQIHASIFEYYVDLHMYVMLLFDGVGMVVCLSVCLAIPVLCLPRLAAQLLCLTCLLLQSASSHTKPLDLWIVSVWALYNMIFPWKLNWCATLLYIDLF